MRQLAELVGLYFPQEKIINSFPARITESSLDKVDSLPLSWRWRWNIFPVNIVETNEKIYIDGRVSMLLSAFLQLFTGPIFLLGFSYLVYTYSEHMTMPMSYVIFLLTLTTLVSIVNMILSFGVANIYFFKTKWINKKLDEGVKTIITGTIPEEQNYLNLEIPPDARKTLSILERLRLVFGKSSVITTDFKISYSRSK